MWTQASALALSRGRAQEPSLEAAHVLRQLRVQVPWKGPRHQPWGPERSRGRGVGDKLHRKRTGMEGPQKLAQ